MLRSTTASDCIRQSPASIRLWERGVIWLALAAASLNVASLAYVVTSQWSIVVDGIRVGSIRPWVFLMPCVLLAAAVLLLLRSRWALPAFFLHVVGSFAYIVTFHGFAAIQWYFWLGYLAELGVVYFCLHLMGRGALR